MYLKHFLLCVSLWFVLVCTSASELANYGPADDYVGVLEHDATYCFPNREITQASHVELLVAKYAALTQISPRLLAAVIHVESRGDSLAVNPNDPSYGLGQVMPSVWRFAFVRTCGSEATERTLLIAEVNVCYTANILKHFTDLYGPVAGIDAYNNGHGGPRGYSAAVLRAMVE